MRGFRAERGWKVTYKGDAEKPRARCRIIGFRRRMRAAVRSGLIVRGLGKFWNVGVAGGGAVARSFRYTHGYRRHCVRASAPAPRARQRTRLPTCIRSGVAYVVAYVVFQRAWIRHGDALTRSSYSASARRQIPRAGMRERERSRDNAVPRVK